MIEKIRKSYFDKISPTKPIDSWKATREGFIEGLITASEDRHSSKGCPAQKYLELSQGAGETIGNYLTKVDGFYTRHGKGKTGLGRKVMYGLHDDFKRDMVYMGIKSQKEYAYVDI